MGIDFLKYLFQDNIKIPRYFLQNEVVENVGLE